MHVTRVLPECGVQPSMIRTSTVRVRRPVPPRDVPPIGQLRSAHLVGICGTGMKALAEYLVDRGIRVTGSDLRESHPVMQSMRRRGWRVHAGHHDRFLPRDVELLVHSVAVDERNPERELATRLGLPQVSYSQMLGIVGATRTSIAVAGTHGKSTTTAMLATILGEANRDPSAIIGAELAGLGVNGWAGAGDELVLEACEYRRSFLDIQPDHALILGVEPDHFDYYADLDDLAEAFADFASTVETGGRLVVRQDCPTSRAAASTVGAEVITFGTRPGADWWIADPRRTTDGTRYRVFRRDGFFGEVLLGVPGRHNGSNAIAAIAMAAGFGVPLEAIRTSLAEFPGVRRRFERVGSWRGITLVDDYAHHPTAVAATLRTAREQFGRRRLWCAFQPHQVSRLRTLIDEFGGSFHDADEVLVAPPYGAREKGTGDGDDAVRELVRRIAERGGEARAVTSLDHLVATVDDEAAPGDVLITMGAGDIDQVHHEFTRRLHRDHEGR